MAAKTSLARQLELLKLPQTSVHKETHGAPSFLYDFIEAKSIDADTHFSVALAGLDGLIQIDPYVETFRDSLFHESSKQFDRGVSSKEANEKINAILEEYLFRVVSRYFQLSDTHKTIEWLIYRYQVNEYNTGALIGSILPYHETRQFVRLLQTCSAVKNPHNTQWYWLKPVQEQGVPLAKSVLLAHCVSSLEFVRFITDSVFKAVQIDGSNAIFPSFLVSFCLNLMEQSTSELIITMIVSVISKAMRLKIKSLYVASYMIFSHLCIMTKLEPNVVDKFLSTLLRHIKADVYEGVLVTFNVICHTQNVRALPFKFLNDDLMFNLAKNSESFNFEPLIKSLLLTIVQAVDEEDLDADLISLYKNYSSQLLTMTGVTDKTVRSLVEAINATIGKPRAEKSDVNALLLHMAGSLEKLHTKWFDSAISAIKSTEKITMLLNSTRDSLVEKASEPPSTKVEDSSKRIRRQSLLHLTNNLATFLADDSVENMEYLKQVIRKDFLDSLDTSDLNVLLETFAAKEKVAIPSASDTWYLVNREWSLFQYQMLHLLYRYAVPEKNSRYSIKEMTKLCRNLLSTFCRKLMSKNDQSVFSFFLPVIANSSSCYLRIQTLSLLSSLLASLSNTAVSQLESPANYQQYLLAYLISLSSPLIAIRQLALSNLQVIQSQINSSTNLFAFIVNILAQDQNILASHQAIDRIFLDGGSVSTELVEHICGLLTTESNYTVAFRLSLLNLLTHASVDAKVPVFKFYYDKYFSSQSATGTFSAEQEQELSALLGCLSSQPEQLFEATDDEEEKHNYFCDFYLACIQATANRLSEHMSFAVYEVVTGRKSSFELIQTVNEHFTIQVIAAMLRVQLALSETGSTLSRVDNQGVINSIKKRLRRVNTEGLFIVHILQHILSIEEIYDTLDSRSEHSSEKRSRRGESESVSKFASGWKLLRIYVTTFQSKESIHNSCLLVKTLFGYLKLTFLEVGDNSNEYTRQTILYALANCIESKFKGAKSSALNQARNADRTEDASVAPMEVDQEDAPPVNLSEMMHSVNVDIIVDCMRESRLKETQKVALLLLSLVAPHFQREILNHLVEIFTFIGTSLQQCDDEYSLAILFETMEAIIPIILRNQQPDPPAVGQKLPESDMSQYIVSIFVKSFADIPSYRRLPLFSKLVHLLGEDRFLSILSVSLLEDACLLKSKNSRSEKEVLHSFLQALFGQFSLQIQLSSLCTLLCLFERKFFDPHLKKKSLQKQMLLSTGQPQEHDSELALGELKTLSASVCQQFSTKLVYDSDKLACGVEVLRIIVAIISTTEFSSSTMQLGDEPRSSLLIYFLNLILELIVSLGPSDSSMKPSLNMYRKRIKTTLDEALLKYHSLLPPHKLIEIVIGDMLANSAQLEPSLANLVKRKALELLNEKLMKMPANELQPELAFETIRSLGAQLTRDAQQINQLDELQMHNMQLILVSLKFSTKFLKSTQEEEEEPLLAKQTQILSTILLQVCEMANAITIEKPVAEGDKSGRVKSLQNLKGSCILCLTQILCTMSLEGIEHLSTVVHLILNNFDVHDDIVLISNVCSLSKLIGKFAQFLSPHIKSIILKLLYAFTLCDKVNGLRGKLQVNWNLLAKLVPKRVIFEAIDASYDKAVAISTQSIVELMALFRLSCDNLEKFDVEVIVMSFKNFMLKALSYRSIHHGEATLATIEQIETSFGEAFSSFIPKLTEASFRPIFFKLLEWAIQIDGTKKLHKKENSYSLSDKCYHRMIAFYRFCSLLADRLKSLFCVFVAPSIVNNCSEMLLAYHSANFEEHSEPEYSDFVPAEPQQSAAKETKLKLRDSSLGEPLVGAILATLSKCFLFDLNGTFVNKDCTSLIVKPIVNQISNLFGSEADFEARLGLILQCTQYLIQNNKDEALIKEFNYQILLKTRESHEKVRVGAIKVLHRLILTCSEDYLPFIPEAIPFIAELSEDESESVEAHVKKLIIDIEQLVGEPINKYL